MSRPAMPESETPLVKRLREVAGGADTEFGEDARLMREAATALALSQTEIKGHMRVEDDLKVRIAELEKDWETDADYIRMAERIKELENDAAALRDALRPFVRVWPNTVSTISLHIAEEMLAKGYAYDVTRDAALKSRA